MAIRILVADDEEIERRALRLILGGSGHADIEVVEASNGREVIEAASSQHFDAAFLDIRMPGIDGIEAARALRERFSDLPVVFLTAHDRFDYARSALRLHVEDFLLKPASEPEVLAALERALSRRSAQGDGGEGRVASAAGYLADAIRAELASGKVSEAGIDRYLSLVAEAGRPVAALVIRCLEARALGAGGQGQQAALAAAATAIEREMSERGLHALAGSGGDRVLCVAFGREGFAIAESALRDIVMRSSEKTLAAVLSGTGATMVAGASYAAGAPCPGGHAAPAPADLARAAASAVSVAGAGMAVVLAPIAALEGKAIAEDGGDGGIHDRASLRALALMEERLAENLSLEAVADGVGVSPSHLSRLLARRTGMGFSDCLSRLRVERAKSYLSTGTLSVKEAASLVGFRDPAYFARVFRRFAGESPAEYRAKARKEGGA